MKAALYLRVSSEEQVDNFSLSAQLNQLTEYCTKGNITIHHAYQDEGLSGTKENRPAFQQMITDAEKGLFQVILVHKFDRFARKVELSQKIKNQLKKSSVNVISITEPIEDSPIGFFQEGLLELLAEYFVKNLSKEVKKGMQQRAEEGLPTGAVPFGYRSSGGSVTIHEAEAEVVKVIFDMSLNGYGYMKICNYLNDIKSPRKSKSHWRHFDVMRILRNPLYRGLIVRNDELFPSKVPIIIDPKLFDSLNERRGDASQKRLYLTSNKQMFLFADRIRCAECGRLLSIHYCMYKEKKYYSYYCELHHRNRKLGLCSHKNYYRILTLEKHIMEEINALLSNEATELTFAEEKNTPTDLLHKRKQSLLNELQRAKVAYLQEVFTLKEYSDIKRKVEAEISEMTKNESKAPQSEDKNARERIKTILEAVQSLPDDDVMSKKLLLSQIIHTVAISSKIISIEFKK